jgi:hypothetical protein
MKREDKIRVLKALQDGRIDLNDLQLQAGGLFVQIDSDAWEEFTTGRRITTGEIDKMQTPGDTNDIRMICDDVEQTNCLTTKSGSLPRVVKEDMSGRIVYVCYVKSVLGGDVRLERLLQAINL